MLAHWSCLRTGLVCLLLARAIRSRGKGFRSWLRLRGAARRIRCRRRSGLALLIALAALAFAAPLAILALPVLALPVFRLAALGIGSPAALARREIGGRRV